MSICFFFLSIIFFVIGLVVLIAPGAQSLRGYPPVSQIPSGGKPAARPAPAIAPAAGGLGGSPMEPELKKLAGIRVGQRLKVPHPVKGELAVHVLGRILYNELWQQARSAQSPWVPTGNQFAGFWLDGEMLLLNWLNRFYLLDTNDPLSDTDIARDFAPHAKKFAQSDQTAKVYFAYPPASWKIDDIGKFQIASVEGATLHARIGAVGRFIHASGDGGRALVVEDYEGGAGQDCAWIGYLLGEEDIQSA
ncbi:MAG: hypothetical protein JW929_07060 [Anaerolineales bacterium]|nr:hypothetical protein [Anaerolineales bacterium]